MRRKNNFYNVKRRLGTTRQINYMTFRSKDFTTYKSDYHELSTVQKLSNTNSIAVEQNNDTIQQQLRLKSLKQDYSGTILLQDHRYHHYCRQMDRLSVMDESITRQYFDETGSVKHN